ncbi:MAG: GAF domain-containing sensor histidine kinase [Thermodesulfobacteriota bacterium]|nr:GAF domain-containing sensor histidine kinase [Thermodesulfobacteriota bacterium]
METPRFGNEIPVKNYKALFNLAQSLHLYPDTDALLNFTTREILKFINIKGSAVLLLDEGEEEFYFSAAAFYDPKIEKKIKQIRFPADQGPAGAVIKTGEPRITTEKSLNRQALAHFESKSGCQISNMLDVPMRVHNRIIGVLSAFNKQDAPFNHQDVELLSAIADTVAHPVENARINQALTKSYNEVKSLNRAKDRVIHHLSHELKTPVSVLAASLEIIETKLEKGDTDNMARVLQRAERNIQRLLEMQYEIEDLLRKKDYTIYHVLTKLFDACKDQLEVLITKEMGGREVLKRIKTEIKELFGPRQVVFENIQLDKFIQDALKTIGFRFADRECRIVKKIDPVPAIRIPREVLMKIFEGLIRNSVENTPDRGEIHVIIRKEKDRILLIVRDTGTGITKENLKFIFENYFTAYETSSYASGRPYAFGAGGKGFDLLRMKIFSEQFNFKITINSTRCPYIVENDFSCPGNIIKCEKCSTLKDCTTTGGTEVCVSFPQAVIRLQGEEEEIK